jgi:murein DD-endopeptidase MepM/ murein hydrolase activator NlpD
MFRLKLNGIGSDKKGYFVVAFAILTKFRSLAGIAAAAATLFSSNPAMANASANADILAPLRAATAAKQDNAATAGDTEFRSLFNSWSALEGNNRKLVTVSQPLRTSGADSSVTAPLAFAMPTKVAIPSRIPVDGVALTSGFGMRWHPVVGGRRAHKGVDLGAPSGTPIYASADGVVSRADWYSSYGLYVSIEHGGEIETRYGHMSRINAYAGQVVKKGDLIGYVGSTGRSTGPHLHYEVRIAGTAVNPIPYLQDGAYKPATLAQAETIGGQGDGEE